MDNPIKKARPAPELVSIGKRQIISTGLFNAAIVAQKVIDDGVNDWVSISDIAKLVYTKSFLANNKRVRGNIWRLRKELLRRGFLLITEGRPVEHVKIYVKSPMETPIAAALLDQMRTRTDISAELYEKAIAILNEKSSEGEAA